LLSIGGSAVVDGVRGDTIARNRGGGDRRQLGSVDRILRRKKERRTD
jgi:hypothetical protein